MYVGESVDIGRPRFDEFEVVLSKGIAVDLRNVRRKEVKGVDTGELSFNDGFWRERGSKS